MNRGREQRGPLTARVSTAFATHSLQWRNDFLPQFRPASRRTPAAVRCRPDPAGRLARGRGRPQRHRQVLSVRRIDGPAGAGQGRPGPARQGAHRQRSRRKRRRCRILRSTSCCPATSPCTPRSRPKPTRSPTRTGKPSPKRITGWKNSTATTRRRARGRLLHGLGFPAETHAQAGVGFFRRLARAPQRRPRADDAIGPAAARRADQPPRPGRGAVAGAVAAAISRARCW